MTRENRHDQKKNVPPGTHFSGPEACKTYYFKRVAWEYILYHITKNIPALSAEEFNQEDRLADGRFTHNPLSKSAIKIQSTYIHT